MQLTRCNGKLLITMAQVEGRVFWVVRPVEDQSLKEKIADNLSCLDSEQRNIRIARGLLGLTIVNPHEVLEAAQLSSYDSIDLANLTGELEDYIGSRHAAPVTATRIGIAGYGTRPGKGADKKTGIRVDYPGAQEEWEEITTFIGDMLCSQHIWIPFRPIIKIADGNLGRGDIRRSRRNYLKHRLPKRIALSPAKVVHR